MGLTVLESDETIECVPLLSATRLSFSAEIRHFEYAKSCHNRNVIQPDRCQLILSCIPLKEFRFFFHTVLET